MGSSLSTTTTAEAGPGLTLDEKTISDPELEVWLRGLSDRTNTSRQTIVSLLCSAVFSSTTLDKTFDDLPQKLLEACDSKIERRKHMLQTPFVDGQTPITWAICNLPDRLLSANKLEKQPPIITALLRCCGEPTSSVTNLVYSACCIRNTPAYSIWPSRLYGFKAAASSELQFSINDFPTRMLVEGRIDMRFIHGCRMYSIGFSSSQTGEWMFFYRIVRDHGEAKDYPGTMSIDLLHKDASIDNNNTPGRIAIHQRFNSTTEGGAYRKAEPKCIP
ncbi:hypothetical protein BKA70DRAFT_407866 [Coprinopsis sp. MPI-PUGE-AT-0042]|nr:hypothetical protein BKA70DRAFT_407866 [Coprinopsis sp. MPI-PUGE-AT-0042]